MEDFIKGISSGDRELISSINAHASLPCVRLLAASAKERYRGTEEDTLILERSILATADFSQTAPLTFEFPETKIKMYLTLATMPGKDTQAFTCMLPDDKYKNNILDACDRLRMMAVAYINLWHEKHPELSPLVASLRDLSGEPGHLELQANGFSLTSGTNPVQIKVVAYYRDEEGKLVL